MEVFDDGLDSKIIIWRSLLLIYDTVSCKVVKCGRDKGNKKLMGHFDGLVSKENSWKRARVGMEDASDFGIKSKYLRHANNN